MNEHFGDWYREVDLEPDHETLTKRWAGIETLAENIENSEIVHLGRLFHGLTDAGQTRDALKDAMFESDNAFPVDRNTQQVRVLSGACLMHIAEAQKGESAQVAAYAVVCPTLLGNRSKILVPAIAERANQRLDAMSGTLRRQTPMNSAVVSKLAEELKGIEEAEQGNTFQTGGPQVRAALEKLRNGIALVSQKANQLERIQALYREDSDILWWMTGRYSQDLDLPLKEVGLPAAAILAGKELSDLIEIQPGPVAAKAVLSRCLEDIGGKSGDKVTLSQAVNKLPKEWKEEWFAEDGDRDVLSLCPVSAAIRHSVAIDGSWGGAAQALSGVSASSKLSGAQLAYQMYRECMFQKLMQLATE